MKVESVLFVGVDVDDQAYHFSIIDSSGKPVVVGVRCERSAGLLTKQLRKLVGNQEVVIGYEATYVGYTLQRELSKLQLNCRVIAPTSIAKAPNERVKNDRKDSLRLALGLYRGEFTFVHVPTKDQEADRQLLRSRSFLVEQQSDVKRHILNQCRLLGLDYKQETGSKSYWTGKHRQWLDAKIKSLISSSRVMLTVLLQHLESIQRQIDTLFAEVEHLAEKQYYKKQVQVLSSFKGIEKVTAMVIATEIFDINRFEHPRQLVSYLGLDIGEYSSGGKQMFFGITKMGNRRLRTVLVEACQKFWTSSTPSKRKQKIREADTAIIRIADRCQERLYKKGHRLLAREKHRNKVKVACAREMVGFLWEAMKAAA